VTQSLDSARPLPLDLNPAVLPDIVDRALRAVEANWSGGPVNVERQYDADLPPVCLNDNFCEQIFVNLAQNAYEAMSDQGGGTLRVSISRAERDARPGIEVRVADSGPGISAELREPIFNPFVTTKKTGVGLGLSIVSAVVSAHGGHVTVSETSGGGATFEVELPLTPTH